MVRCPWSVVPACVHLFTVHLHLRRRIHAYEEEEDTCVRLFKTHALSLYLACVRVHAWVGGRAGVSLESLEGYIDAHLPQPGSESRASVNCVFLASSLPHIMRSAGKHAIRKCNGDVCVGVCLCVCVVVYLAGYSHRGSDKRVVLLRQGLPRKTGRELGHCCTCCRVGWGKTQRKK
jgi:hypothetical protein